MPSWRRARPPTPNWPTSSTPSPPLSRAPSSAGRPGPGLGERRGAASADRRRRGARLARRAAPDEPDAVRRRRRPPCWTELSPAARAMLDHVEAGSGEADAGLGAARDHARRGRHPRRGADRRAGCWCRVGRGWSGSRARCRSRCAAGTPPASRIDVPPEVATSERDVRAGRPRRRRAPPSRRYAAWSWWSTTGAAHPPVALRSGAARRCATSRRRPTTPSSTSRRPRSCVEVAAAAGLLATWPDADGNPAWTPTEAFDTWCDEPRPTAGRRLARAWLDTERLPFLVGTRDDAGKPRNALDPELTSRIAPETPADDARRARRRCPPGEVLATGTGPPSVVARLAWLRPRRPPSRADQVVAALDESGHLGSPASAGSRRTPARCWPATTPLRCSRPCCRPRSTTC